MSKKTREEPVKTSERTPDHERPEARPPAGQEHERPHRDYPDSSQPEPSKRHGLEGDVYGR